MKRYSKAINTMETSKELTKNDYIKSRKIKYFKVQDRSKASERYQTCEPYEEIRMLRSKDRS